MKKSDPDSALNNINDSAIVIDQDYTITFVNENFRELIRISAENIVGEICYCLLHHYLFPCTWKSVPETECPSRQVFQTGHPMSFTHNHKMPDGSEKSFKVSSSPVKDENGSVIRIISIFKELT